MKHKILKWLLMTSIIALAATTLAAQENFDITVSLKGKTLGTAGNNIPVRVKITNKSAANLNTEDLSAGILFKFSKCRKSEKCLAREEVYFGGSDLKPKILKKDETLDFVVNLTTLNWNDANAPLLDFSNAVTMSVIPEDDYFFFAEIRIFDKKESKTPTFKSVFSNEIEVRVNPKSF